jgi:hypothetical protein
MAARCCLLLFVRLPIVILFVSAPVDFHMRRIQYLHFVGSAHCIISLLTNGRETK